MRRLLIAAAAAVAFSAVAVNLRHAGVSALERERAVELDGVGCVVACDVDSPVVHFLFSADSTFEGGNFALDVMDSMAITGSFFFTGNFLERPENAAVVSRAVKEGHYVGMHSNRHLLLADWDRARTTLVTVDSMLRDLDSNLVTLNRFEPRLRPVYTLPPYEWCGAIHAQAYREAGYTPVNPTPGIETCRDYTTPDMREYMGSAEMLAQLWDYESRNGLDGALVLIHLGTEDSRTDKLWRHLPAIFDTLQRKGYRISRL